MDPTCAHTAGTTPASPSGDVGAPARPRVIVVGSGFGGLFAVRALRRADVDITLIGRTTHHLFQPLLYQVATGILSPGEIAPASREVLAGQRNVTVLLGDVTAIDLDSRRVTVNTQGLEHQYGYDHIIVATGANQSWFGRDEFSEHAPGMKSIDDALELRSRIYDAFELAEIAGAQGNTEVIPRLTTFVVVGAGPTGVEMAGQLAELSRRTLTRDFRYIDTAQARVILLDAAPALLSSFDPTLQTKAQASLERLGVEVRLSAKVVEVDADGLVVQGSDDEPPQRIEAATKVWAAGVAASPLAAHLAEQVGLSVDRQGRIPVQPDLTLPGHPEVHVVGDMVALDNLPGVAQVAIQGARHSAREIRRGLAGDSTGTPFVYKDKGSMATISRFKAIAEVGRLRLTGFLAWVAWLAVHLVYIVGFKNRLTTLVAWSVSFVGRGRSERTFTEQQLFGRRALERHPAWQEQEVPTARPGAASAEGITSTPAEEAHSADDTDQPSMRRPPE